MTKKQLIAYIKKENPTIFVQCQVIEDVWYDFKISKQALYDAWFLADANAEYRVVLVPEENSIIIGIGIK